MGFCYGNVDVDFEICSSILQDNGLLIVITLCLVIQVCNIKLLDRIYELREKKSGYSKKNQIVSNS